MLPDPTLTEDPDYDATSETLSRRMKHLAKASDRFWKRNTYYN